MGRDLDPSIFMRQIGRRLWALLTAYENVVAEDADFRPLFTETPPLRVSKSSLAWNDLSRYSNRQKTKLKIGGLVGYVLLSGELETWWPMLVAATEIHVGKGSVMGLGKIRLEKETAGPPDDMREMSRSEERCAQILS